MTAWMIVVYPAMLNYILLHTTTLPIFISLKESSAERNRKFSVH